MRRSAYSSTKQWKMILHNIQARHPSIHTTDDKRYSWRLAAAKVAIFLVLPLGGSMAFSAAYFLLAGWAMFGPRRAIEAMTISVVLGSLHPGIYPGAGSADALRWLIIIVAFFTGSFSLLKSRRLVVHSWFGVFTFVVVAACFSIFNSYAIDVSLFKLVTFLVGASAVLFCFHATRHLADYWRVWFLTFFSVIVLISFPLIVHPLGYARNESGFQGLTLHPQTYVVLIAPFLAWLVALLLSHRLNTRVWAPLAAVTLISLIATKGRTGALACTLSLLLTMFLKYRQDAEVRNHLKRWLPHLIAMTAIAFFAIMFSGGGLVKAVESFVLKGESDNSVSASFEDSRGFLITRALENFRDHKLTGIGFGVASIPSELIVQREPMFGLPISAPVEKGFILISILEEVGLIGFIFFAILLWGLLSPTLRKGAGFAPAVLAMSALLVNFGEAVFFSMNGLGLLIWLLIGAARVMARQEVKR